MPPVNALCGTYGAVRTPGSRGLPGRAIRRDRLFPECRTSGALSVRLSRRTSSIQCEEMHITFRLERLRSISSEQTSIMEAL
jgi:hypothetical protein